MKKKTNLSKQADQVIIAKDKLKSIQGGAGGGGPRKPVFTTMAYGEED